MCFLFLYITLRNMEMPQGLTFYFLSNFINQLQWARNNILYENALRSVVGNTVNGVLLFQKTWCRSTFPSFFFPGKPGIFKRFESRIILSMNNLRQDRNLYIKKHLLRMVFVRMIYNDRHKSLSLGGDFNGLQN